MNALTDVLPVHSMSGRPMLTLLRISDLSNETSTMTAIDHHPMIGDSNCTNSNIATVKCACAAAVVAAEGSASRTRRNSFIAPLKSWCSKSVSDRCFSVCLLLHLVCAYRPHSNVAQSLFHGTCRHLHSVQRLCGSLSFWWKHATTVTLKMSNWRVPVTCFA